MWTLPRPILNKMFGHAQRSLPRECVGVLSGQGKMVRQWHPLVNEATDNDSFLAEPASHIAAFRAIREAGQEVVAIYHSHPTASVVPSARDVAQAWYPDVLHIILAMNTDGRLEMAGYCLVDGVMVAQEIDLGE